MTNRDLVDLIETQLEQIIKFNRNRENDGKDPYTIRSQAGIIGSAVEGLVKQRIGTMGYALIFPDEED